MDRVMLRYSPRGHLGQADHGGVIGLIALHYVVQERVELVHAGPRRLGDSPFDVLQVKPVGT